MKDALLDRLDDWRWAADRRLGNLALELRYGQLELGRWVGTACWGYALAIAGESLITGVSTTDTGVFLTFGAIGVIGHLRGLNATIWAAYAAMLSLYGLLYWTEPRAHTFAAVAIAVGVAYAVIVGLIWPEVRRRTR